MIHVTNCLLKIRLLKKELPKLLKRKITENKHIDFGSTFFCLGLNLKKIHSFQTFFWKCLGLCKPDSTIASIAIDHHMAIS